MARLTAALLAIAASAGLSGCAYGAFGFGIGDGYYDDYYGSYYGWYDDYYYPGWGYYIYDIGGQRYRWNDHHRRYWESRREGRDGHEHWARWDRRGDGDGRRDGGDWRGRRDGEWGDRRDGDRRDGDRRGDRDGWRGNGGTTSAETAIATPTVRQDPPRGEGRRDGGEGGRQGWRGNGRTAPTDTAGAPPVVRQVPPQRETGRGGSEGRGGGRGDGQAGYQPVNPGGRSAPVSESPRPSPEVARESRPAPSRSPEVVRESRVIPIESPKAPPPPPLNRESVRQAPTSDVDSSD